MGLLTRLGLGGKEKRMPAPPGTPWGDTTPPTNGMLTSLAAGVAVNEKNATGIAAVYACVSIIADALSTLPLNQFKGYGDRKKQLAPSPILTDPWPEAGMNNVDWLTGGQVSMCLRGNFYGEIAERDNLGFASLIRPIDPDKMRVTRNRAGEVEYREGGNKLNAENVFHVRNLIRPGSLIGLNPIEELRNTFGLAMAQDQFAGSFFANSANPSGVLETTEDLTEEETLALARAWMQSHQGIGKANMPAVLTGGLTWRQITMNLEDAQFIQSRSLSVKDIAMVFRVPPHMIGDVDRTTSWGTGIEQQELGFVRTTLGGYLRRWETALSALLPPNQYVKFDLRERLRGDTLQRFQAWTLAHNGGWMTANMICDEEGFPRLPGDQGDKYLQPVNIGTQGPDGIPTPMSPDKAAQSSGTVSNEASADLERREMLTAILAMSQRAITVNVPEQPVEVHLEPVINIEQPNITVQAAKAPNVNIQAPPIPDVNVHMDAPVTHVAAPNVQIDAPVTVNNPEPGPVTRKITRDSSGNIAEIEEVPSANSSRG